MHVRLCIKCIMGMNVSSIESYFVNNVCCCIVSMDYVVAIMIVVVHVEETK